MKMLGVRSVGLSLSLHKSLPLRSDLGSSAAAVVVNKIFCGRLRLEELVLAGLKSEERVSGYHADNGGFHSDSKLGALGAHDAQLPCRERPLLCPREPGLRGTHEEDARSFACIMLNGSC
jgi:hypothetical protein